MSKFCKKITCPNRISYGQIEDPDVINMVCPKCEDLLYVSDIRKSRAKKKKNMLLFLFLMSVIAFIVVENYNIFVELVSNSDPSPQYVEETDVPPERKDEETVVNIDWSNNIRGLIDAESERDLNKIKEFYADNISQYYDLYVIDKIELGERYRDVWEKSLESSNEILSISKLDKNTYIMRTTFKDINRKSKKRISIDAKVKFIFDEKGKIIQSYNVD